MDLNGPKYSDQYYVSPSQMYPLPHWFWSPNLEYPCFIPNETVLPTPHYYHHHHHHHQRIKPVPPPPPPPYHLPLVSLSGSCEDHGSGSTTWMISPHPPSLVHYHHHHPYFYSSNHMSHLCSPSSFGPNSKQSYFNTRFGDYFTNANSTNLIPITTNINTINTSISTSGNSVLTTNALLDNSSNNNNNLTSKVSCCCHPHYPWDDQRRNKHCYPYHHPMAFGGVAIPDFYLARNPILFHSQMADDSCNPCSVVPGVGTKETNHTNGSNSHIGEYFIQVSFFFFLIKDEFCMGIYLPHLFVWNFFYLKKCVTMIKY